MLAELEHLAAEGALGVVEPGLGLRSRFDHLGDHLTVRNHPPAQVSHQLSRFSHPGPLATA